MSILRDLIRNCGHKFVRKVSNKMHGRGVMGIDIGGTLTKVIILQIDDEIKFNETGLEFSKVIFFVNSSQFQFFIF